MWLNQMIFCLQSTVYHDIMAAFQGDTSNTSRHEIQAGESHRNDELCHAQGLGQLGVLPGLPTALKSCLKLCLQMEEPHPH